MLSKEGMRMATYFNSDGSIDRNEWESIRHFWVKLGRAGYWIEESPSEFDSWVKVKVHLVGFDPIAGQLICGVTTCMRNDGWRRAQWGFIRQQARLLREALPTDREAELAIGLLPSWSPQDAVAGFPDLLMAVSALLRDPHEETASL